MLARLALGDVLTALGAEHHGEARDCFSQARATAREIGLRSMTAHALLGLGRLAGLHGDAAGRDRTLSEARNVFVDLGLQRYADRAERWLTDGVKSSNAVA